MNKNNLRPLDFDDEMDRQAMAGRLREAREYLGFSQDEVAKYLGVSRSALSNIESGQRKVDALELKRLSIIYKRPAGYFTGEDQDDQSIGTEVAHLARKAAELAPEDLSELGRFADFLKAKKKGG